ncbi:hypothetical protein ACFW40_24345 [Streptomyces sp. NPDC058807]|uniref:hypothetical protein n=1 Tax=unclassified Streptomyces TaxID=2593676 RepID=UPI003687804B
MNRRPTLLAAAALTAVAALSLSACGGGEESSEGSDKIAGADTGGEASTSASPSASGSAERPKITLPPDVKDVFTPEKTGDAAKDAVLRDNAEFVKAMDAAIVAGDPEFPALEFYTEGEAAAAAHDWVKGYVDGGLAITGTVRYYDRKVEVNSENSAAIGYCADESKAYDKVIKTGEVKRTVASENSYVAYTGQLRLNDDGVWETTKLVATRGASACQR